MLTEFFTVATVEKLSMLLILKLSIVKKNINRRSSTVLGTLNRSTLVTPHMLTEFFRVGTVEKFPNHIF